MFNCHEPLWFAVFLCAVSSSVLNPADAPSRGAAPDFYLFQPECTCRGPRRGRLIGSRQPDLRSRPEPETVKRQALEIRPALARFRRFLLGVYHLAYITRNVSHQ